jgi:hypothetical protein
MRFARWKTKGTDTRLEYAILIASPQQQRLRERASVLRLLTAFCRCEDQSLTLREEPKAFEMGALRGILRDERKDLVSGWKQ